MLDPALINWLRAKLPELLRPLLNKLVSEQVKKLPQPSVMVMGGGGGGSGGISVHSHLTGLDSDDHPQYLTQARADARYTTPTQAASAAPVQSVATRTGQITLYAGDINGLGGAATLNVGTAANAVAAGDHLHTDVYETAGAVAAHTNAVDPHAQYHNDARGDDRYLKRSGGTLSDNISIAKDGNAGFDLSSYGDSYSTMLFRRYRGSRSAPGAVLSGDLLGGWVGQGYDSSGVLRNGAILYIQAAGDFSSSSAPSRFLLQTTPVGSTSPVTRVRIEPDGTVLVNTGASDGLSKLYIAGDIGASSGSVYRVNGVQTVSARRTGWGTPTGTATRTAFATTTVTTAQLAERVKALIDDLTAHGLIGS